MAPLTWTRNYCWGDLVHSRDQEYSIVSPVVVQRFICLEVSLTVSHAFCDRCTLVDRQRAPSLSGCQERTHCTLEVSPKSLRQCESRAVKAQPRIFGSSLLPRSSDSIPCSRLFTSTKPPSPSDRSLPICICADRSVLHTLLHPASISGGAPSSATLAP